MIKKEYKRVFLLAVIVGLLVCVYIHSLQSQWGDTIAAYIIAPFLRAQHALLLPIKRYCSAVDIRQLQQTIQDLEQERDQLQSDLLMLYSTQEFQRETQELVQYKKRYVMDTHVLAQIILKHLNDHEQYILVDQGEAHGVCKDMVAVYKNALIGRVAKVYPYYSKVILITDPLCKVAAFCAQTKAFGIAEGVCSTRQFVVTHVNHFDILKKGDYIISSGAGLIFPKGFGLGTIDSFTQDGLFYTVHAKPLMAIDKLEYCYLIKKGTEN